MKKYLALFLFAVTIPFLSACRQGAQAPKTLDREGIAPYQLSESDTYLLRSFGMDENSKMISFFAPAEAKSLRAAVYRLKADGVWESTGGITVLLGKDASAGERLKGTFAMRLDRDYAVDLHINAKGVASGLTDAIDPGRGVTSSVKSFLTDFQEIKINREIPVALMVYGGDTQMRSHELREFDSPGGLRSMAFVQAVTLTFSDRAG